MAIFAGNRKFRTLALAFTLTAFIGVNAGHLVQAQNPSAAQQPVAPVLQPGDVELTKSVAMIFVGATGLGHEHGVEGHLAAGHISFGAAQNAGVLVFDMKSFAAETTLARQYVGLAGEIDRATADAVTKNMHSEGVLNVAKFPQAKFEITSALPRAAAQPGQPQEFVLDGQFTLRGVTQPLRVLAVVEPVQGWSHVRGGFTILQTKYGITPFSKALGAVGVADELKIWGDFWVR